MLSSTSSPFFRYRYLANGIAVKYVKNITTNNKIGEYKNAAIARKVYKIKKAANKTWDFLGATIFTWVLQEGHNVSSSLYLYQGIVDSELLSSFNDFISTEHLGHFIVLFFTHND